MHERLSFYFTMALTAVALALLFFVLQPVFVPLTLAIIGAALARPVFVRIVRFVRFPSIAALCTVAVIVVCILVPLGLLGFYLLAEIQGSYLSFTERPGSIGSVVGSALSPVSAVLPEGVTEYVAVRADSYVRQLLQFLAGGVGAALIVTADFLLKSLVFLIALYYLLMDGPALKERIIALVPLSRERTSHLFTRLNAAARAVVIGSLFIATVEGVVSTVGYWLFNVPQPVLWGTLTAFAALVPGVGTSLALIPAVAYLVLTGAYTDAALLAVWGALAVGLVDNLLAPKVIGKGARIPPLLILLSVVGGIAWLGPVGIFLGPLIASAALALLPLYEQRALQQ